MEDSEKLKILISAVRSEILYLEPSMEQGQVERRERMENALLKIGVEPYIDGKMLDLLHEIEIIEDEDHFSRYGF